MSTLTKYMSALMFVSSWLEVRPMSISLRTGALLQKSAKPTNGNSPPIHRWVWDTEKDESVQRTAGAKCCKFTGCSVVRFTDSQPPYDFSQR